MRKIAVLDDYQTVAAEMADWSALGRDCAVTFFDRPLGVVDAAARALADFEIVCLMRERMPFPRVLIERLPKLKLIVFTGGRIRTLDLEAAREKGITVTYTRGAGSQYSTSELTWALILAAARNLCAEDRAVRAGDWQKSIGTTQHGKTLGILGLGNIGSRVAAVGRAFGMEIVAWSPNLTPERAEASGARAVTKADLFRQSDIVTIHMILSERTRGLVGPGDLALMQRHAILINTARGPIVEETALVEALRSKRIAGAGLDVFDQEPLPPDHPLRRLENVVLSPHLGYVTREIYAVFFQDMVENIAAYLAGKPVRVIES